MVLLTEILAQEKSESETIAIAYIAGLMDGEGNIHFQKRGDIVEITIDNTNCECLNFIRDFFKFGRITAREGQAKILYRFRVYSLNETRIFLETVMPYLIVKKSEAIAAIDFLRANSWRARGAYK